MKYLIFFVLAFVALAAAAPQYLTYPGYVAPLRTYGARTLVTSPTVVNTGLTWPGRYVTADYFGGYGTYF